MSCFRSEDDKSSSSNGMMISSLPDDVLLHKILLEFLTVPDLLHLAATNQFWYQTLNKEQVLWKSLYYERFQFSRQDLKDSGNSCRVDFQQRYRMLQNLLQQNNKKKRNSCFNLPHKHFDYVEFQLHDDIDDDRMLENDMPLVLDCCDSFCMWSGDGGISSHLVVLNPYTLEWQIQNLATGATTAIGAGNNNANENDNDMLWGMDLEEYFPDQNIQNLLDEEFDLIPLGVDCKATTSNEEARMIIVGKSLRSMERVCNEFVGTIMTMNTSNQEPELEQQQKYICRIPGEFHHVDVDAEHRRVMVCQIDPQNLHKGRSTIQVYPMVIMEEASKNPCSYFPNPAAQIQCDAPIQTFVLSGPNLVVATETSLEVWKNHLLPKSSSETNGSSAIHRLQHRLPLRQPTQETTTASNPNIKSKMLPRVLQEHLAQSHRYAITSLHVVTHPTTHQVTHIVTLLQGSSPQQHGGGEYWMHLYDLNSTTTTTTPTTTTPSSVIHLPLGSSSSSSRTPRISINANRLLVLGQDHVGAILLVYALRGDHDDDQRRRRTTTHTIQEASGGVYNLTSDTSTSSLHLANRIRHVALGGWHDMDHVHMVANERYIVLTTREGHHLNLADDGKAGQQQQGVLVIDLKK